MFWCNNLALASMLGGVLKEKGGARGQINTKIREGQEQNAIFRMLTCCSMQSEDERWRGVRE